MYVTGLVVQNTVNTMPEKTLEATADHAEITGDTVSGTYDQAEADINALEKVGVSYNDVVEKLETEGIKKFEDSWEELLDTVSSALRQ